MTDREYSMGFPLRLFSWKSFQVILQKGMIMERRMIEIGHRLSKAREEAGYSQEAFAEKIGCCAITISRWENGHTPMKVVDIIRITEALNMSADYLLGIEKQEDTVIDMPNGLSPSNREIVMNTLKAMISTMKS